MNKEQTYFKTLVFAIQTIDSHGGQKEISKLRRVLDGVLNYEKVLKLKVNNHHHSLIRQQGRSLGLFSFLLWWKGFHLTRIQFSEQVKCS